MWFLVERLSGRSALGKRLQTDKTSRQLDSKVREHKFTNEGPNRAPSKG